MKKSLSLLALILAVSTTIFAKEYPLYVAGIQVTDDNRENILPGVKMDDPKMGNVLHLHLNNATVSTTKDNADGIYFSHDDDYSALVISLNGVNHITTTGRDASAICIAGDYARLEICPEADSYLDSLYIDTHLHAIMLNGKKSQLMFGNLDNLSWTLFAKCGTEPLYSNENDAEIILYNTTLDLLTDNSNPIVRNFKSFDWTKSPMPIVTLVEYVFEDGQLKSSGKEVTGALVMIAPLPIAINNEWMYPGEINDFRPEGINKKAQISYNVAQRILTFENVQMEGTLQTYIPDLKLYLKGDNVFSKNVDFDNDIFYFRGSNAKICGDANATLEIDGGNAVNGIGVNRGLEINDIDKLTIKNANMNAFWGLKWNADEGFVNNLVINSPIEVASTKTVFYGFNNTTWANYLIPKPADVTYNTSSKKLVNASGQDVTNFKLMTMVGIESVSTRNSQAAKYILNGQVLIQSQNGRTFNLLGTQVK